MVFLGKRIIKQVLIATILGFVVRRLMSSDDPRAQRIGNAANRITRGAFGPDKSSMPQPRSRTRRAARSAATAAAGSAMSYFFDPVHGSERRAKVKRFAGEKLHRNGREPHLLPPVTNTAGTIPSQVIAPGVPS